MSRKPAPRKTQRQVNRQAPKPVALPVAPNTAWRLIFGSLAALGCAALVTWALAARLPDKAMMGLATKASSAGFSVRQVDIQGVTHQPKLAIYREVLTGGSDSMLLTDLEGTRTRLLALPWVKDVSLTRRWPDRLEVRVDERKPLALWQNRGRIRLIDTEGLELPAEDLADFAALPMVVGAGAEAQAAELVRILKGQPEVAEALQAALWVGQRRWDLRLRTGETISLPEGPGAEAALIRFGDIHRDTPLLGRGFVRFDMRIPDKMVVRVAGGPGTVAKPRPAPKVQSAPQALEAPALGPQAPAVAPGAPAGPTLPGVQIRAPESAQIAPRRGTQTVPVATQGRAGPHLADIRNFDGPSGLTVGQMRVEVTV